MPFSYRLLQPQLSRPVQNYSCFLSQNLAWRILELQLMIVRWSLFFDYKMRLISFSTYSYFFRTETCGCALQQAIRSMRPSSRFWNYGLERILNSRLYILLAQSKTDAFWYTLVFLWWSSILWAQIMQASDLCNLKQRKQISFLHLEASVRISQRFFSSLWWHTQQVTDIASSYFSSSASRQD